MDELNELIEATRRKTEAELEVKQMLQSLQDEMEKLAAANTKLSESIGRISADSAKQSYDMLQSIRSEIAVVEAQISTLIKTLSILLRRGDITIEHIQSDRDVEVKSG